MDDSIVIINAADEVFEVLMNLMLSVSPRGQERVRELGVRIQAAFTSFESLTYDIFEAFIDEDSPEVLAAVTVDSPTPEVLLGTAVAVVPTTPEVLVGAAVVVDSTTSEVLAAAAVAVDSTSPDQLLGAATDCYHH